MLHFPAMNALLELLADRRKQFVSLVVNGTPTEVLEDYNKKTLEMIRAHGEPSEAEKAELRELWSTAADDDLTNLELVCKSAMTEIVQTFIESLRIERVLSWRSSRASRHKQCLVMRVKIPSRPGNRAGRWVIV